MGVFNVGIDVGSTTLKLVVYDEFNNLIVSRYERHYSDIKKKLKQLLNEEKSKLTNRNIRVVVTGSGGIGIANSIGATFIQEVIASSKAIKTMYPETDVAIELGGEDAKITFLTNGTDQRMNGSCAGGTGSFIDQMATLLNVTTNELNDLAKEYDTIYPIAARCGVFAKTDVQPLLNEGARKEDISASVLQAIVVQTISGLACGRDIKGKVAFLGGPLYFLSELRNRFIETLKLNNDEVIFPDNAQFFVAMGAALYANTEKEVSFDNFMNAIENLNDNSISESERLEPLFDDEEEYNAFIERHSKDKVKRLDLATYEGDCFLGIDAGSTTTKVALIASDGSLLFTHYGSNDGSPVKSTVKALKELYSKLPSTAKIVNSAVTGYGEAILQSGLKIDIGEIETVAHYKAADFFCEGVDFVMDIGGQDMKCLRIKDGVIESIILNEACSAGCGSFLDTFATSLGLSIDEFANSALKASNPVDLGSRCTVFMNSRVKQSQKEGATVSDISSGLSYSVIKNALYKVVKIKTPEELGEKVVVQGGTFYNNAVLRAFEKLTSREVIRPDISGIMGAFGVALIAKERFEEGYETTLIGSGELDTFNTESSIARCKLCTNNCLLTINKFNNGNKFISGNRCEKGAGVKTQKSELPNLYEYKYNRLFDYKPLDLASAKRGKVGMPRALNIYENYPFWHTLFTELGFSVVLSDKTSNAQYEKGMNTIPSESVCYPAKLVHGHIADLVEKQCNFIFYPSLPNEQGEFKDAHNNYNCPIVTSYPEVIKNNMDSVRGEEMLYLKPFLPIDNKQRMKKRLITELSMFNISDKEMKNAVTKAYEEQDKFRLDVQQEGVKAVKYIKDNNVKGIVLAGRPYHVDPHINHGIPEMVNTLGMVVLTEDSVSNLGELNEPLRVLDQWTYHSRLYRAANFVSLHDDIELVQLNSFGCGIDAVTTDQVQEILNNNSKIYTTIKIDEGNNLGAARIRLRSLKATMDEREKSLKETGKRPIAVKRTYERVEFTKEMKETHTILVPQMSPIHFKFAEVAFGSEGYNLVVLDNEDKSSIEVGLKYVNNDVCYPAIIVVGQIMEALLSGKYDLEKTSVMLTQTGGGCRASNYIAFLRKAFKDAGLENVPIISLNAGGLEKNSGFKLDLKLINKCVMSLVYGDLFMNVLYRVRPYEKVKGSAEELYNKWSKVCMDSLKNGSRVEFKENIRNTVEAFDEFEITSEIKPKVGVVGEILVKYHPVANNDVVKVIEDEGGEAVVPGLIDFFLYSALNDEYKYKNLAGSRKSYYIASALINAIEYYRKVYLEAINKSDRFYTPSSIRDIAKGAETVVDLGHQTGEGWFLTGEMVELIEIGVKNIICMQPFACLPNHVMGKGVMKELKALHEDANIVAVDFDPGASEVNQLNRIKLMISTAFENLERPLAEPIPMSIKDKIKMNKRAIKPLKKRRYVN